MVQIVDTLKLNNLKLNSGWAFESDCGFCAIGAFMKAAGIYIELNGRSVFKEKFPKPLKN